MTGARKRHEEAVHVEAVASVEAMFAEGQKHGKAYDAGVVRVRKAYEMLQKAASEYKAAREQMREAKRAINAIATREGNLLKERTGLSIETTEDWDRLGARFAWQAEQLAKYADEEG